MQNDPIGFADFDGKDYTLDLVSDSKGNITGVNISGTVYIQGNGADEERAEELNSYASSHLQSKNINGINVSVKIKYSYDKNKNSKSLKAGENILTFANNSGISHIEGIELREGKNVKLLTGNTGVIYNDDVNDDNVIFHESLHLLGLSDRYDDFRDIGNYIGPASVPHKGFENDIMGNREKTNVSRYHYEQWLNHALLRVKGNSNVKRVIGLMQVDRDGNGNLRTNKEKGGIHKYSPYANNH